MDRKYFIRNLFGTVASAAIAPTVKNLLLSKTITQSAPTFVPSASRSLISDLQTLTPYYYSKYVERYGIETINSFLSF